jgi:hypothetical protein
MITKTLLINVILIFSIIAFDVALKLKLENAKLSPFLCAWVLVTSVGIILYSIYLILS